MYKDNFRNHQSNNGSVNKHEYAMCNLHIVASFIKLLFSQQS